MKKILLSILIITCLVTSSTLFAQGNNYQTIKESLGDLDSQFVKIPGKNYSVFKTEMTQKIYKLVMDENPSEFSGDNLPVENVSWYDCVYFCNKLSIIMGKEPVYNLYGETDPTKWPMEPHDPFFNLDMIEDEIKMNKNADGYRLPTQSEWEYAAKGGAKFKYSGGNTLSSVAWYYDNSNFMTHKVCSKKANGYGLFDMSGNVWEWCWDANKNSLFNDYVRGGCCEDTEDMCRISYKYAYYGYDSYGYDYRGFRPVMNN